jgi:hypothetical protein
MILVKKIYLEEKVHLLIMANRRYNTQVTNDRACMSKGGSTSKYHTTKEGKKAKKGLWYNIAMKKNVARR